VRWKGPVLAVLGAAALAVIAIWFSFRGGISTTFGTTAPTTIAATGPSTSAGGSTTGTAATTTGDTTTGDTTTIPRSLPVRLGHRLLVATADDALKQADPAAAASLM